MTVAREGEAAPRAATSAATSVRSAAVSGLDTSGVSSPTGRTSTRASGRRGVPV
ncbi:hypothetical protein [Streptomyces sp. NPDC059552]|uniref:hypothetical protein n=1 Tax=Streptomyces sp. NPDC059552 TaxID=3346862 RepID=UPI0036C22860